MTTQEILKWQWETYPKNHTVRDNLLIHIVAVPIFWLGSLVFVLAILNFSFFMLLPAVAGMVVSMFLQKQGHALEATPPEPFIDIQNALHRIVLEQWVTFPKFVITGAWWQALQKATPPKA